MVIKQHIKTRLKGSEFIEFLRERVILLRELMSDNGSFLFAYRLQNRALCEGNVRRGVWSRKFQERHYKNKVQSKKFQKKSLWKHKRLDIILHKTKDYIWNEPKICLKTILKNYLKK